MAERDDFNSKPTDPFIRREFLAAAREQQEYASGERQIDSEGVQGLLDNPKLGQMLEGMLRDHIRVGRYTPEQLATVESDTNAIIASIQDPNVILTGRLTDARDHFLRMVDTMGAFAEDEIADDRAGRDKL